MSAFEIFIGHEEHKNVRREKDLGYCCDRIIVHIQKVFSSNFKLRVIGGSILMF